MKMRFILTFAIAAAFAVPAYADPFCDALSRVLSAAPAGFSSLRGAQDSDDERFMTWRTTLTLPGTSDCSVQKNKRDPADPSSVEDYLYSCGVAAASVPEAHASALAMVKACLPGAETTGYTYDTGSGRVDYVHARDGIVIIHDGLANRGLVIIEVQQNP